MTQEIDDAQSFLSFAGAEKRNRVSPIKFAEMDTAAVHRGDDI